MGSAKIILKSNIVGLNQQLQLVGTEVKRNHQTILLIIRKAEND